MECIQPIPVYYLASGRLGVPLLDVLAADRRVRLAGVGTQPDRPRGRRLEPEPTPVGMRAAQIGIPAERVPSVNDEAFLERLRRLSPEVVVVASFGQIFRTPLLALPRRGCLNVHASLLPRHRGASPISAAILAGDERTGITFMRVDAGLDTGPIFRQFPLPIAPDDTAESLETRLGTLAAETLVDCLVAVAADLVPTPQPAQGATYAPRLTKEDGLVDWARPARHIERQVRAMIPWPIAYTTLPAALGSRRLQILAAAVEPSPAPPAPPGEVLRAEADALLVACGEGCLRLLRVRAEGRNALGAADFLRGCRLQAGSRLGAASPQGSPHNR